MQITKILDGELLPSREARTFTREDLQNEYDFYLAEKITALMYEAGLISEEEKDKISAKNRDVFRPELADILV